jgi:nonribosomal peptide synthetase protein BlmVII
VTAVQLLATLRRLGVELTVDGDELVCHAPREAMTDELRAALVARKPEVLAFLRQARGVRAAARDRITPLGPAARFELSAAQRRLWFLDQWGSAGAAYNIAEAFRLDGPVEVDRLRTAIAFVVQRHEVLRTRFASEDGIPYAVIEQRSEAEPLQVVDLRSLPAGEQEERARRARLEVARRPFDLGSAPLFSGSARRCPSWSSLCRTLCPTAPR